MIIIRNDRRTFLAIRVTIRNDVKIREMRLAPEIKSAFP